MIGILNDEEEMIGELNDSEILMGVLENGSLNPPTPGRVGDHFVAVLSDTSYTVLQTSVHSYTIVEEES